VEGVVTDFSWSKRRVFVTGHTGFKGGWLSLWLNHAGSELHGYSLDPLTEPNLFKAARIKELFATDLRADIRDVQALTEAISIARPEIIYHLAAQSLVRPSYDDPSETFSVNVVGTSNLFQAARECASVKAIVVVTSDKCYENREWMHPYRETDRLGGFDPYSASKACQEIVAASFRSGFSAFRPDLKIATVRAGNVIGGGDWSRDRLVPDCMRAFSNRVFVELRYPNSIRPWMHVAEPISGYINLGERLLGPEGHKFAEPFNFGPSSGGDASVGSVAERLAHHWGDDAMVRIGTSSQPHEAGILRLDSSKARATLGWFPRWLLDESIELTVAWYKAWYAGHDIAPIMRQQIESLVRKS
jgi:CDP-glucose 4,6-dehydratase